MSPATILKVSPLASLPATRHRAARRQRTLVVRTMAKGTKKALTYDAGWSKVGLWQDFTAHSQDGPAGDDPSESSVCSCKCLSSDIFFVDPAKALRLLPITNSLLVFMVCICSRRMKGQCSAPRLENHHKQGLLFQS